MKSKLTLKPGKEIVEKVKKPLPVELTGVVAQLAGLLAGVEIKDAKEEYAIYLMRKYS